MEVYHCSPDYISEFDFKFGVHFGGLYSAYEAGLRKLNNLKTYQGLLQDELYVHICELKFNSVYESEDVGGQEDWLLEIEKAKQLNCDVIRYINKYEIDTKPSYLVINKELIILKKIEVLSSILVKKELESHGDMMDF